ncbi:hypothetical protein IAU60_002115 [Kwoniella sp. DSM 27419]
MSQPIPAYSKPRSHSTPNHQIVYPSGGRQYANHQTQLPTPSATPPSEADTHHPHMHNMESRLQQILAHFESGTHSFCREDRDEPVDRRMSFGSGHGEVFPTPPGSRRTSFLSSLSLSRPFAFTPTSGSAHTQSHPDPKDFSMSGSASGSASASHSISTSPDSIYSASARPPIEPYINASGQIQSSPAVPISQYTSSARATPGAMSRSKTAQAPVIKQNGFMPEAKRHFDPSREPKLLGLL